MRRQRILAGETLTGAKTEVSAGNQHVVPAKAESYELSKEAVTELKVKFVNEGVDQKACENEKVTIAMTVGGHS